MGISQNKNHNTLKLTTLEIVRGVFSKKETVSFCSLIVSPPGERYVCIHGWDLFACFMEKMRFQKKTIFIFIFYCATVSRENFMKLAAFFLIILASKMKLADGFIILRRIKLWNRHKLVGKKNETDGLFFLPTLDGFIILSP